MMLNMTSHLQALRATLRSQMPVTRHLGIEVAGRRGGDLVLRAPLAANLNHTCTAFAGSLNAAATLAGWGTIWLLLIEHAIAGRVVIQDSSVHYERPVTTDFEARCAAPDEGAVTRLLDSLRRRGRGRIELAVTIANRLGVAVQFRGRYVASLEGG